jgi:hypothetical protein
VDPRRATCHAQTQRPWIARLRSPGRSGRLRKRELARICSAPIPRVDSNRAPEAQSHRDDRRLPIRDQSVHVSAASWASDMPDGRTVARIGDQRHLSCLTRRHRARRQHRRWRSSGRSCRAKSDAPRRPCRHVALEGGMGRAGIATDTSRWELAQPPPCELSQLWQPIITPM